MAGAIKKLINDLNCRLGIHPIGQKWCFEEGAAIYEGGICPHCGQLKQGNFLGNLWEEKTRQLIFDSGQYLYRGSLCKLEQWFEMTQKEKEERRRHGLIAPHLVDQFSEFMSTYNKLNGACGNLARELGDTSPEFLEAQKVLRDHIAAASDEDLEQLALQEPLFPGEPVELQVAFLKEERLDCFKEFMAGGREFSGYMANISSMGTTVVVRDVDEIAFVANFDKFEGFRGDELKELKNFGEQGLKRGTRVKFTLDEQGDKIVMVKPLLCLGRRMQIAKRNAKAVNKEVLKDALVGFFTGHRSD